MRISDWSSDVCSSDLRGDIDPVEADHASREFLQPERGAAERRLARAAGADERDDLATAHRDVDAVDHPLGRARAEQSRLAAIFDHRLLARQQHVAATARGPAIAGPRQRADELRRSEERRVGTECGSTCRSTGSTYQ